MVYFWHDMPEDTTSLTAIADDWLGRFEGALQRGDEAALRELFHPECHWRDLLSFTWDIRTVSGAAAVASSLKGASARNFRTDPARTPPRHVMRAGEKCIEAIFRFDAPDGPGAGVLRLRPETPKAWTLLAALTDLQGHEERVGQRRPKGQAYSRDFAGPNWLD